MRGKLRVGSTEAQKVVTTAANRGTALHTILEHYITGQGYLGFNRSQASNAHSMAQTVFEKGMKDKISEYYATEATLFYPDLYAGATDMVAIHNGCKTVLLTLNKRINRSAESGSRIIVCSLSAYAMAHKHSSWNRYSKRSYYDGDSG